jgi:hypothetical protein
VQHLRDPDALAPGRPRVLPPLPDHGHPEATTHTDPREDPMIGRTYLERSRPVVVLICGSWARGSGPRNVIIERPDGSRTIRPFRGLRRP